MSKTRTTFRLEKMWITRTTKTGAKNTAVQIVRREHQQTIIVKHIGTARNSDELLILQKQAEKYIFENSGVNPLFPELFGKEKQQTIIEVEHVVNNLEVVKTNHTFAHTFLTFFYAYLGFTSSKSNLLRDLVIIRIIEPCSKLHSLELLNEYFSIHYGRTTMHEKLSEMIKQKETFEKIAVSYARKHLNFDFSIVFYDVTTLYFESFKEDEEEFRKPGFSKDNKANQPQIVIGLIVTKEGFPVSYDVFAGNTFEGKTFIPTICKFRDIHKVLNLTVVADAAMMSLPNIQRLIENNLSYIVGARVANLKQDQIKEISNQLSTVDGASTRIETDRGLLVCDFSLKRYQKDKREMERQIARAEKLLEKKEGIKRTKFLTNRVKKRTEQILNISLIKKTKLLLGIKGYYTNLSHESNKTIIDHYHNLWHVEQTFRIAKSDLNIRPIYHFKRQTVGAHILICFMALAVCKYMELKTERSTKAIMKLLKKVTDARILNTLTDEEIVIRSDVPEEIQQLLKTLSL